MSEDRGVDLNWPHLMPHGRRLRGRSPYRPRLGFRQVFDVSSDPRRRPPAIERDSSATTAGMLTFVLEKIGRIGGIAIRAARTRRRSADVDPVRTAQISSYPFAVGRTAGIQAQAISIVAIAPKSRLPRLGSPSCLNIGAASSNAYSAVDYRTRGECAAWLRKVPRIRGCSGQSLRTPLDPRRGGRNEAVTLKTAMLRLARQPAVAAAVQRGLSRHAIFHEDPKLGNCARPPAYRSERACNSFGKYSIAAILNLD